MNSEKVKILQPCGKRHTDTLPNWQTGKGNNKKSRVFIVYGPGSWWHSQQANRKWQMIYLIQIKIMI